MERFAFFNDSANHLLTGEDYVCLGSSREDNTVQEIEDVFRVHEFILDATAPGKFISISTGNYLVHPRNGKEYYDNYNNRILLVKAEAWEQKKKQVAEFELNIYKEFENEPPEWLVNLAKA